MSVASTISYNEYTPKTTQQTGVGTFVNPDFKFAQKWTQPDKAHRCHENAFLMYDEIRRKEDLFINSAPNENGLAVRTVRGKLTSPQSVDAFRDQGYTVMNPTAQSVNGANSVEWSGFFVPDANMNYTFSLTSGATGRIWVGDVACYDFLESNQTKIAIGMKKGKYYAIRVQYLNNLSQGTVNIFVNKNGVTMTNPLPNFKVIKNLDGTQFFRKLMYYGLVGSGIPGSVFHFWHNNQTNYKEIQDSKFKNVVVYDRVISSNTVVKTYVATETQKLEILLNTPYSTGTITSATYGYGNRRADQTLVMQSLITNANSNGGSISINGGGYNALFGDPYPGHSKTTTVTVSITLNEDAKKNGKIYLNNNCQVVVDFNVPLSTQTPNLVLPIFSTQGRCHPNSTLHITNDGKVNVNDKNWISTNDNNKTVANIGWNIPNKALSKNTPLDTLTSDNGKYRLEFSKTTGKILYKRCFNPTIGGGVKYTTTYNTNTSSEYTNIPIAYYLYRPIYNELGGKIYMSETTTTGITLTPIQKNSCLLLKSKYRAGVNGSILTDSPYTKYPNILNNAACQTKCDSSPDCGNYAYNKNTKDCSIDTSANNRPIYTSRLSNGTKDKMSSIYRKMYKMAATGKNLSTYNLPDEYSQYSILPDAMNGATLPNDTIHYMNRIGSNIRSNYNVASGVIGTGAIVNEPFIGGSNIEGFRDIPERYLTKLPAAPDTSTEEGRINDLQSVMYQQNVLYSLSSIAAISFFVGAIVLTSK